DAAREFQLLLELRHVRLIEPVGTDDELERDRLVDRGVGRLVDAAHAAFAEQALDPIAARGDRPPRGHGGGARRLAPAPRPAARALRRVRLVLAPDARGFGVVVGGGGGRPRRRAGIAPAALAAEPIRRAARRAAAGAGEHFGHETAFDQLDARRTTDGASFAS